MSAARRALLLAFAAVAAAALAPARAEERCTAVRVTYTGPQPGLTYPNSFLDGSLRDLLLVELAYDPDEIVERLESSPAREELVLVDGYERWRRQWVDLDPEITHPHGPESMRISMRLQPRTETEWRLPDGTQVSIDGVTGKVKHAPGPHPRDIYAFRPPGVLPEKEEIIRAWKGITGAWGIRPTGKETSVAGHPCRWFTALDEVVRGCRAKVGGREVLLAWQVRIGFEEPPQRPFRYFERRAVRVEVGACVDMSTMRPPTGAVPAGTRPEVAHAGGCPSRPAGADPTPDALAGKARQGEARPCR